MSSSTGEPAVSSTQPADGAAELRCPLCEYDLRGLPEPRCPECGHRFEWEELTDPSRQKLGWFFEHRRWLGGYVSTQWRMLRPYRFWTVLRPAHRVVRGRLWRFTACTLIAAVLSMVVMLAADAMIYGVGITESRQRIFTMIARNPARFESDVVRRVNLNYPAVNTLKHWSNFVIERKAKSRIGTFYPPNWGWKVAAMLVGFWIAIVAGMGLILLAVWQSRGRAAAKGVHLVRVVVYSADPTLICLSFLSLAVYYSVIKTLSVTDWIWDPIWPSEIGMVWMPWVLLVVLLWSGLRFAAGVRRYLGIAHAEGVALAGLVFSALLFSGFAALGGWQWMLL